MTISAFDIYLVALADKINFPAGLIASFGLGVTIFLSIAHFIGCDTVAEVKKIKTALKTITATTIICGFIAVFVPSSKTIAAMYVLPAIINNEHIQNSTGNALEALENLTKEWLRDTVNKQDSKQSETNI